MGVSVESDRYAFRIEHLRAVGAAVKFISAEPLLGPLDALNLRDIHWLIAGGESGQDFRTIDREWIISLRDQCIAAEVPFFFKQWGGRTPKSGGRELDGCTYDGFPFEVAAALT
jgi:protein gp37